MYKNNVPAIKGFKQKGFEFLSNMYPCKIQTEEEFGHKNTFLCSESFYMAHKSGRMEDFDVYDKLDGYQAKRLAKTVQLRPDWDQIKLQVMEGVVRAKFMQNQDLAVKLINTYPAFLEETNTWNDHFWGVCKGRGLNNLGKILMKVRYELMEQCGIIN